MNRLYSQLTEASSTRLPLPGAPSASAPSVAPKRGRLVVATLNKRKHLYRLLGMAYLLMVAGGAVAFELLGCSSSVILSALGAEWCHATTALLISHLLVTAPTAVLMVALYSWRLAARVTALGAVLGGGLATMLALRLRGLDPPPGFGIDGVPLGGALVAGLGSWLIVSLAALAGYYRNDILGRVCTLAGGYFVCCMALALIASFEQHIMLGAGLLALLLFLLGWTAQVRRRRRRALLRMAHCTVPRSAITVHYNVPRTADRLALPPAAHNPPLTCRTSRSLPPTSSQPPLDLPLSSLCNRPARRSG